MHLTNSILLIILLIILLYILSEFNKKIPLTHVTILTNAPMGISSYAIFFFFSLLIKRNAHKPAKTIVMTTSTGITGIGETLAQTSFSP